MGIASIQNVSATDEYERTRSDSDSDSDCDRFNTFYDLFANGSLKDVQEFLTKGGDPNEECGSSNSQPIHLAALNQTLDGPAIVKLLIATGADVNAKDIEGTTPLYSALENTSDNVLAIVQLLMENGAAVNIREKSNNETPLHWAVLNDTRYCLELVQLLIDAGADVNVRDEKNAHTPLFYAVDKNKDWNYLKFYSDPKKRSAHVLELVQLLIDSGADMNSIDRDGHTPLSYAANNSKVLHDAMVEIVEQKNKWSPLRRAWVGAVASYQIFAHRPTSGMHRPAKGGSCATKEAQKPRGSKKPRKGT